MKAFLMLEDGTLFQGTQIGAEKEVICEIVFHTSMTGYLEELTDPAYAGQAVCMTYPLIGNYGICREDCESRKAWPEGIIIRELSRMASNFRKDATLSEYLKSQGMIGITGIDTRALTKHLRIHGTMTGCILAAEDINKEEILSRLHSYHPSETVAQVTCKHPYEVKGIENLEQNGFLAGCSRFDETAYRSGIRESRPSTIYRLNGKGKRVALLDVGVKHTMLHALTARGCDVKVYPAFTQAEEILADAPDGVMISSGPGNPKSEPELIAQVGKLYQAGIPMLAVGLGHQLLALAAGGDTCKMKYGHRGANHPVKDRETGKVLISSQNHGYVVDMEQMDRTVAVPAFVHVNDGTCEGLRYLNKPALSVQFFPDTSQARGESAGLLDRFLDGIKAKHM